jgi:hypothetical protein
MDRSNRRIGGIDGQVVDQETLGGWLMKAGGEEVFTQFEQST